MRRITWLFLTFHVVALVFGVVGITVAIANPTLWANSELGRMVFSFGTRWGGGLANVLGAVTMFLYGLSAVGLRRTTIFAGVSVISSLAAELIGTSTGWPFGNYSYTSGLGYKVFDRVPFTIPPSWFTIGFATYLIANRFLAIWFPRGPRWLAVPGGVFLLVVWDLALDPAMAHQSLATRFWIWHVTGPYFGMPVINLVGWALTGLWFTTLSRLLWRADPPSSLQPSLPLAVYLANLAFASALCLTVGLWQPVMLAMLLGALPALLILRSPGRDQGGDGPLVSANRGAEIQASSPAEPRMEVLSWIFLRLLARLRLLGTQVHVHNLHPERLRSGAILAVQHVHHLDDGCLLLKTIPRPVHIVVALDWVPSLRWRAVLERLCSLAGWPVLVRPAELARPGVCYTAQEAPQLIIRAIRSAVQRIVAGQLVAIFPEGYPVIDPHLSARRGRELAPFQPGVAVIARTAARKLRRHVAIIPIAIRYTPRSSELVFGDPIFVSPDTSIDEVLDTLQEAMSSLIEKNAQGQMAMIPIRQEG